MTYQHPGPPPPPYGPPTPKRRSTLPWVLGTLAAIVLICCGGGAIAMVVAGGDNKSGGSGKTAAVGEAARDGKFEFVVTGSTCGGTTVGAGLLTAKAQGTFCLVKVTVRNIGDRAQTFDGSSQKAFDTAGTQYSNDPSAELAANNGTPTFLESINPGNRVSGALVFDVPSSVKLARVELHDSPFSGGVTVALR